MNNIIVRNRSLLFLRSMLMMIIVNFREILNVDHPVPLRPFLPEIDSFTREIHSKIINTLLRSVYCFG